MVLISCLKVLEKMGILDYFAVSNNQTQGENSGDLGLIMLGKEPKKSQTRWLGNWLTGRSLRGRKAFPCFLDENHKKINIYIFGVTREENSPLLFTEVSLSLQILQCCLLSELETAPRSVFVLSTWHNHFGLFPSLLGFGRLLA